MNVIGRSMLWALVDLLGTSLGVALMAVNPPHQKASGVEMKAEYLLSVEWDVNQDADVDIHMLPPSKKPVFYGARDVGCATLDRDNRGFMDSIIALADGSTTRVESDKETIAIRCNEFGHYDLAVNLYAYHDQGFTIPKGKHGLGLRVHAEIVELNPSVRVIYAKDVTLDHVGQTINWAAFDMDRDGKITVTDVPLEPITDRYQHASSSYTPESQP